MSKKALLAILFLLISALGLSGCDPSKPPCVAASLDAPTLGDPALWEILDPSAVVLNWDLSCEPDQFEIILSQERDFSILEYTELVTGDNTSWSPPTLDIAEEYFWRVAAIKDSTKSAYSFQIKSFFTEPVCDLGDLVLPNLILPTSGGIYTRGYDSLEWEWPISSCIPEAYKVEVSPDSGFIDQTWFGGTGNPSTRWGPSPEFDAATQYWWRIIPSVDNNYGPPSLTSHFFTDPVCIGASLVTPDELLPADRTIVTTTTPEFSWSYPDPSCSPEGFHLRVSSTEDMSSIVLEANNPTHGATSFQAGVPFDDCQILYWDVAVVSEGMESPYSVPKNKFLIDATGACTCAPGDIPTPILVSPNPYEIVADLQPVLEWHNPGPCMPGGYNIKLSPEYDFATDLGGGAGYPYSTGWVPSPLDPATQYHWKVAGGEGTSWGDFGGTRSFFTPPECTSITEVEVPVRLSPADGEVLDTLVAALHYRPGEPGCIPDGYLLHLHQFPDLSDPNQLTYYPFPGTTVFTELLTDCTLYFWTVTAKQGVDFSTPSDIGWFYTNESGACPSPPSPGIANSNTFCRIGTFADVPAWKEAVYLFMEGDYVPVIAKNPFDSYLMSYALKEDGITPLVPLKPCWLLAANVKFLDPKYPKELPIENPPPTPIPPPPTPTPTPVPVCHAKLGPADCKAAGGTYDTGMKSCSCP
jgi:hypothetical protein